jgi:hypothetical protein
MYEFTTADVNTWIEFPLENPFAYEGSNLSVVIVNIGNTGANYSAHNYLNWRTYTNDLAYYTRIDGATTQTVAWSTTSKLNMKLNVDYTPGQKYRRSNAEQIPGLTSVGATNVGILKLNINASGARSATDIYQYFKDISFDGKESFDAEQIKNAKLYYTGNSALFSASTQIGATVTISEANVNNIRFELSDGLQLLEKDNYFWLTYDISDDEAVDYETVDAKLNNFRLFTIDEDTQDTVWTGIEPATTNPDPDGERIIRAPMSNGIYYVGENTGQAPEISFATLAELATNISQIGVTRPTEIIITDDLTEREVSKFGVHSHADKNPSITLRPMYGKTITINNTAAEVTDDAGIWLQGNTNFTIDGSNDYEINGNEVTEGTDKTQNLIIKRNATTIRAENGSNNFTLRNTQVESATGRTAVIVDNSDNIVLSNNQISKAYNGFYINHVNDIDIDNNLIGSATDASSVLQNGIAFLYGVTNANISNNTILNIRGTSSTSGGIYIYGDTNYVEQATNINIFNNLINDVSTASTANPARAFYMYNISDVNIYHNTVNLTKTSSGTSHSIFYGSALSDINLQNNLFNHNAVSSSNPAFLMLSDLTTTFDNIDNNLYNGNTNTLAANTAFTTTNTFAAWQESLSGNGAGKDDANSNFLMQNLSLTDDYHIDGAIVLSKEILVPVIPEVTTDMDGIERGQAISGVTTAGYDEAIIALKDKANNETYLPPTEVFCEGSEGFVLLAVDDKEFDGWEDKVERTAIPEYNNIWVDNNSNILNEDGGYTINYPYFYI